MPSPVIQRNALVKFLQGLVEPDEGGVSPLDGLILVYMFLILPLPVLGLLRLIEYVAADDQIRHKPVVIAIVAPLLMLPITWGYLRGRGVSMARYIGFGGPGAARAFLTLPWLALQGAAVMILVLVTQRAVFRWLDIRPRPQQVVRALSQSRSEHIMIALAFVAIVLAPIVEEILFRGLLFKPLKRGYGRGAAYMVSAVLFALVHANLFVFAPLFTLAIILAWAYEKTGRIVVPIALHALLNAINVLIILAPSTPTIQ